MTTQCNDPRVDIAWKEYQSWAFEHSARDEQRCGRCDSYAISVLWADEAKTEVILMCKDCEYSVQWPVDRAYWMWKIFVQPQNPMLEWKIENDKAVYFNARYERTNQ